MFNKKIIKLNLSGVRARLKTWSAERPSTDKDPNKGRHSTIWTRGKVQQGARGGLCRGKTDAV